MILENKRLSRRTFLRGAGAAVALPMLDIMATPARADEAATPGGSVAPPKRAAFFYVPNGVAQKAWHPTETGVGFQLSPTLEPLAPIREKISLFSKLDRVKVSGTDGHAQAGTCWLSSASPEELSPAGYPLKKTIDQIIAQKVGRETPFRSLELSCNPYQDNRESIYFDNISWYGHGHAARSMRDPKKIFDRLFSVEEAKKYDSVLDLVLSDAKSLERQLGRIDRRKLDEYMDSVRTVERQIQRVKSRQEDIERLDAKKPVPEYTAMRRDEYIQLIGDLMILAFRADLTRVSSIMSSPERWGTPLTVHGLFDKPIQHHGMTHAQGNKRVLADLEKLDRYHVDQFAKICAKMDAIEEGESTLLDNSLFLFGSGLSSGKTHVCTDLPTVIAGKGGLDAKGQGLVATNRHNKYADGTPIANLWVSMARHMGIQTDRIGDSTGALADFLA